MTTEKNKAIHFKDNALMDVVIDGTFYNMAKNALHSLRSKNRELKLKVSEYEEKIKYSENGTEKLMEESAQLQKEVELHRRKAIFWCTWATVWGKERP
jgi:ATP-dependent helicase/DNAse subunit B